MNKKQADSLRGVLRIRHRFLERSHFMTFFSRNIRTIALFAMSASVATACGEPDALDEPPPQYQDPETGSRATSHTVPQNVTANDLSVGMDQPGGEVDSEIISEWSCASGSVSDDQDGQGVNLDNGEFSISVRALALLDVGDDCPGGCCSERSAPVFLKDNEFYFSYRSQWKFNGPWGRGWDHTFGAKVFADGEDYLVLDGAAQTRKYESNGEGIYLPEEAGVFQELKVLPTNEIELRFKNGTIQIFYAIDGSTKQGKLKKIVDRNGNSRSLVYNGAGSLKSVKDSFGRQVIYSYNSAGRIKTLEDYTGRKTSFRYSAAGFLTEISLPAVTGTPNGNDFPAGIKYLFGYDKKGNLLTVTYPNEAQIDGPPRIKNTYQSGKVITQVVGGVNASEQPAGGEIGLEYLAEGENKTRVTDRNGNITDYVFDEHGLANTVIEYSNRDIRSSDPESFTTRYEYDEQFNRTREDNPLGNYTVNVFDYSNENILARGNLLQSRSIPDTIRGGDQNEITNGFEYEPVYQQRWRTREERSFDGSTPGTQCPSLVSNDLFTTLYLDYQEGRGSLEQIAAIRGVTSEKMTQWLGDAGVELGIGDVNFDGNTNQVSGNIVKKKDPSPSLKPTLRQKDLEGSLQQQVAELYRYSDAGQVIEHEDAEGVIIAFSYDDYKRVISSVEDSYNTVRRRFIGDPLQLGEEWGYDIYSNLASNKDPRGVISTYLYTPLNWMILQTDAAVVDKTAHFGYGDDTALGYRTYFKYDANGNVVTEQKENKGGNVLAGRETHAWIAQERSYDILDRIVKQSAIQYIGVPNSVTQYKYDANENLVYKSFPGAVEQPCNVEENTYDERDLLFEETAAPGSTEEGISRHYYDDNGNQTRKEQLLAAASGGLRSSFTKYDGFDREVEESDERGSITRYGYDAGSRIVTNQAIGITGTGEGDYGQLSDNTVCYDELGRQTENHSRLFKRTETARDIELRDGSLTPDDDSISEFYEYDRNGELTFKWEDNGGVTEYEQNAIGFSVRAVDEVGNVIDMTYDGNENLVRRQVREVNPLFEGYRIYVTYDLYDVLNRNVRSTDSGGNTTYLDYDSVGRVANDYQADGTLTSDPWHLVPGEINEKGTITRYYFDEQSHLMRKAIETGIQSDANPDGKIVIDSYYDINGRRVAAYDDNANETLFEYNCIELLAKRQNADGTSKVFSYNEVGEEEERVDENGNVFTFIRDEAGNTIRIEIERGDGIGGTTIQEVWYDGLNNGIAEIDNNDPSDANDDAYTERKYDSFDRVIEEKQNGKNISTGYYAGNEEPTEIHYPNGEIVKNKYDLIDRLLKVEKNDEVLSSRSYLGQTERLLQKTYGNGVVEKRYRIDSETWTEGYDNSRRPTEMEWLDEEGREILQQKMEYDREGNLIENALTPDYGRSALYYYDKNRKLISYKYGNYSSAEEEVDLLGNAEWEYDGVGNRRSESNDGEEIYYSIDDVNEYTDKNSVSYQYNDGGQLVQEKMSGVFVAGYAWDAFGRMIGYTNADGIRQNYKYDGQHRRTSKISGEGNVERYWYLDNALLSNRSYNSNTEVTEGKDFFLGREIEDVIGFKDAITGSKYFYHQEPYGTVNMITGEEGHVIENYRYSPFGKLEMFDAAGSPIYVSNVDNNLYYKAGYRDEESGNYHFLKREYVPGNGRFTVRDPKEFDAILNQYSFVENNPGTFSDPLGESVHPTQFKNCSGSKEAVLHPANTGATKMAKWARKYTKKPTSVYRKCGKKKFKVGFGCAAKKWYKRYKNRWHWRQVRKVFRRLDRRFEKLHRRYKCESTPGQWSQCDSISVVGWAAGVIGKTVHICPGYFEDSGWGGEYTLYNRRAAVLVHEYVHKENMCDDKEYDREKAREMKPKRQRRNPANYEYFVLDYANM